MVRGNWQSRNYDIETEWLGGKDADPGTGFDPQGWEASIWIAHSMYELSGLDVGYTHDDKRRANVASGLAEPALIGDFNFDDVGTVTGSGLGFAERPMKDWVRVRWAEMAQRLGTSLDGQEFPPCFKWFPYKSWPASIEPPTEGSLDQCALEALTPHLERAAPSQECVAAYGIVTAVRDNVQQCFSGSVSGLRELIDPAESRIGTPSNVWPRDRSWFVYTDWDLWGTKVSGPRSLIRALVEDETLETLRWPPLGEADA